KGFNWGRVSKTLSFWILLFLIPFAFYQYTTRGQEEGRKISYSRYAEELNRNNVSSVVIEDGQSVTGMFKEPIAVDGIQQPVRRFKVTLPIANDSNELEALKERNVAIDGKVATGSVAGYLLGMLPYLLLIGFWIFLFRQMQAGGAKAFSFGKSKAKLLSGDTPKITFADVAGADEAKEIG